MPACAKSRSAVAATRTRGGTGRTPAGRTWSSRPGFFGAIGHGIAALWWALAVVIGGLARAVARNAATARDLEPEHRRDGAALGVIVLGVVSAIAAWVHGAGPPRGGRGARCRGAGCGLRNRPRGARRGTGRTGAHRPFRTPDGQRGGG